MHVLCVSFLRCAPPATSCCRTAIQDDMTTPVSITSFSSPEMDAGMRAAAVSQQLSTRGAAALATTTDAAHIQSTSRRARNMIAHAGVTGSLSSSLVQSMQVYDASGAAAPSVAATSAASAALPARNAFAGYAYQPSGAVAPRVPPTAGTARAGPMQKLASIISSTSSLMSVSTSTAAAPSRGSIVYDDDPSPARPADTSLKRLRRAGDSSPVRAAVGAASTSSWRGRGAPAAAPARLPVTKAPAQRAARKRAASRSSSSEEEVVVASSSSSSSEEEASLRSDTDSSSGRENRAAPPSKRARMAEPAAGVKSSVGRYLDTSPAGAQPVPRRKRLKRLRKAGTSSPPPAPPVASSAVVCIDDDDDDEEEDVLDVSNVSMVAHGDARQLAALLDVPIGAAVAFHANSERMRTLLVEMQSAATACMLGQEVETGSTVIQPRELLTVHGVHVCKDTEPIADAVSLRLAPHQYVGINWLWALHASRCSGVLADAMGLGKSVQVAVFLALVATRRGLAAGPHCIVTPGSTLTNWVRELHKWAPELRVGVYRGGASRYEQQAALQRGEGVTRGRRQGGSDAEVIDIVEDAPAVGEPMQNGKQAEPITITDSNAEESSDTASSSEEEAQTSSVARPASATGRRPAFDVLLTTYNLFDKAGAGPNADRAWLRRMPWDCLVLDEGHAVKNAASARHKYLSSLTAQHRFLLSGTPVQNNLQELFALMRFVDPAVFDQRVGAAFNAAAAALEAGDDASAKKGAVLDILRRMLEPFILRRNKETVMSSLPPKTDVIVPCDMTSHQHAMYTSWIAAARSFVHGGAPPAPGAAAAVAVSRSSAQLFTDLRKVAQHPLLQRSWYSDVATLGRIGAALVAVGAFSGEEAEKPARVLEELQGMSDWEIHDMCWQNAGSQVALVDRAAVNNGERRVVVRDDERFTGARALLRRCCLPRDAMLDGAKVQWLAGQLPLLLDASHAGYATRKVLLFSQWTKVLDILGALLEHEWRIEYARLDGSTPVADRQGIIDRFTADDSVRVFLLSTRAGGLGLNLVAADTVIVYDEDLNPHVDAQAVDRAHRMGQTRPVSVLRLMTANTTDEVIHRIAARKAQLDAAFRASSATDFVDLTEAASAGGTESPVPAAASASQADMTRTPASALARSRTLQAMDAAVDDEAAPSADALLRATLGL